MYAVAKRWIFTASYVLNFVAGLPQFPSRNESTRRQKILSYMQTIYRCNHSRYANLQKRMQNIPIWITQETSSTTIRRSIHNDNAVFKQQRLVWCCLHHTNRTHLTMQRAQPPQLAALGVPSNQYAALSNFLLTVEARSWGMRPVRFATLENECFKGSWKIKIRILWEINYTQEMPTHKFCHFRKQNLQGRT